MNDNQSAIPNMGEKVDAAQEDGVERPSKTAKNKQQQGSFRPEKPLDPTKTSAGKSTGPRTVLGKQRSSHNAFKHGFYSRNFLLKSESSEYRSLVSAFSEAFPPVGTFEELLIEDLAMCWIHKKRYLQAEHAEIALATDFVEVDLATEQQKQLYELQEPGFHRNGLLSACSNPFVLTVCIAVLNAMYEELLSNTFDPKKNSKTLDFVYGLSWTVNPSLSLMISFNWLNEKAETSQLKQGQEATPEYEEARKLALWTLEIEIERLRTMKKSYAVVQERRIKFRKQAARVPSSEASERLLRYSVYWNREFERKLSLLERIQKMRRGLPVAPAVRVELSS
jgi:hypothetical protein